MLGRWEVAVEGAAVTTQEDAPVIFRGRAEKLSASTLSAVTPTGETAVVRLDELIREPAGFELSVCHEMSED